MTRLRSRTVATASLLGAVALLATACGGSSGGRTSAAVTTTTAPSTTGAIVVQAAAPALARPIDGTLRTPDGRVRTYHLYVPKSVGTGPGNARVPLLVALHGGTGWGSQFERNSGFDGLAESNRFIVVYPDGIGVGASGTQLRTWNGGACCGPATKQNVDDVTFIRLLIARIQLQYAIDPGRVVATGHSNGGILAYRLACELSDQIAAIGVQSSSLEVTACRPAHPVSVLHIHGSGDENIPISGGVGPKAVSGVAFNPPVDGPRTLATADGCPTRPTRTTDSANTDLTITTWSPCHHGTQVTFIEVAGASHAWMGHSTGASGRVGTPYTKLDSSLNIWNFLSQHRRA